MGWKRGSAFLFSLWLTVNFGFPIFTAKAAGGDAVSVPFADAMLSEILRKERALLIGIDDFVSKPDIYPSSTNNVYAMQEVFQSARDPLETLIIPGEPVKSTEQLARLIRETFYAARPGDVNYLYISTHGEYDPQTGEEPALLLSDGETEGRITPAELESAFDGIEGIHVLILDACNSGAFIGKGDPNWQQDMHFLGDEFKVLTSSGALEQSWYWRDSQPENAAALTLESGSAARETHPARDSGRMGGGRGRPQGAFYFTHELLQSLSPRYGYAADANRDGLVTLSELYESLLQNHAPSTPQVYPQQDDFVIFRYDQQVRPTQGEARSPILNVAFSEMTQEQNQHSVTVEYTATRPVRVGYQYVYQRDGIWRFDEARIKFDDAERFTAFGDQEGAVSAGHKVRAITFEMIGGEPYYGYMMVQLVSFDQGNLTVHGGRVFGLPPDTGDLNLSVEADARYNPLDARELRIFVKHAFPCDLSVAVVNEQGEVIVRLCHRQSTRPSQTDPSGSLFYWDGRDKNGNLVPNGMYHVRAAGVLNDAASLPVLSAGIEVYWES